MAGSGHPALASPAGIAENARVSTAPSTAAAPAVPSAKPVAAPDPATGCLETHGLAMNDLTALADRCVQCGLCLQACPTYRLEALETESPRGRIALVRAWEQQTVAPTADGEAHLDHCLGCRRCEAVCPANVEYGRLLVGARVAQRRRRRPGWRQRAIEALAARPALLTTMLQAYRHLYPLLPAGLRPVPRPPRAQPDIGSFTSAAEAAGTAEVEGGESAQLFLGCVARGYEAPVRAALARLCAAAGVRLRILTEQTCCGSLHAHAGDAKTAQTLATLNRTAFADADTPVLTVASGCHEAVAEALGGCAIDALSFLAARAERFAFAPRPERIALHLPCTQRNVVGSDGALRALLGRVPGLEVVIIDAGFGCCGAAGTAMLTDPSRAARFRQPLIDAFTASGATRLLSANLGCRLHLSGGTALPVQHPLEFLGDCLQAPSHHDHGPAST